MIAAPPLLPTPPLSGHALLTFLLAVTVLLVLARALGALAVRAGLPAVAGELATGFVLGPSLLGHLAPGVVGPLLSGTPGTMPLLDAIGQIGVLLLVGVTGMRMDVGGMRLHRRAAATLSACGLVIPFAAGVGVGLLLPGGAPDGATEERWLFACFLGVALCVSAVPVIAKTLSDLGMLHRDVGQLILAAAMVDDAVGWLLLSVLTAAATVGLTASGIATSVALLLCFIAVAATLGRIVVRRTMDRLAAAPDAGPAVGGAVAVLLVGALVSHAIGIEPIFGAFVAGLLLTGSPTALARLAPLRTVTLAVFTPLFLATAGLRADLTALADPAVALTAVVVLVAASVGKFAGAYLGARLSGRDARTGLALGAGMNARGVVEVVIALTGLRLGILDTGMYTVIVLVALVTSVTAPPVLQWTMRRVVVTDRERLRAVDHARWDGRVAVTELPDPGAPGSDSRAA